MSESIVSTLLESWKHIPQDDDSIKGIVTHLQVLHPVLTLGLLVLRRLDLIAKLTGTQPRPAPALLSGDVGLLELRGFGELIAEGHDQAAPEQLLSRNMYVHWSAYVEYIFGQVLK